ncbi:MAG: hypothetical protein QOI56_801, partial [Actinomycetota bacterium]|nr:hypothetical protein [Actinomycetota bacterium]
TNYVTELQKSAGADKVFQIVVRWTNVDTIGVEFDLAVGAVTVLVEAPDHLRQRVDDLVWYDAAAKHPVPIVIALNEFVALEVDRVGVSTLLSQMQTVGDELATAVRVARPTLDQLRGQLIAGRGAAEVIRASLAQEASMDAAATHLRELEVAVRMLTGSAAQRGDNIKRTLTHYGAAWADDSNVAKAQAVALQAEYDLVLVAVLHGLAVQYSGQLRSLIDRGTHLLEAQRTTLVGFQSAFFAAIGVAIAFGQLLGTDTVNFPAFIRREAVFTTVVVASLAFAVGLLTAGESLDATRKGTLHEALLLTAIAPAFAVACITLSSPAGAIGPLQLFFAGVIAVAMVVLTISAGRVHKRSRRDGARARVR